MHSLQTEVEFMTKQCKLLEVKIVILQHWSLLQQLEYLVETWNDAERQQRQENVQETLSLYICK